MLTLVIGDKHLGMTMWKLPMFCWAVFITQCIILVATPGARGRP